MKFKQCILERQVGDSNEITTSWLPEKFAVCDKMVSLKNRSDESWSDGWIVFSVGSEIREKEEVLERSRDYTRQRKCSDI
jgi:hypothetical protein